MTYQEKNTIASLVSFVLILGYYLTRLFQLAQNASFNQADIFRLWGIVIVLGIVGTIVGTIFTQVVSAIIQAIKTRDENPKIDDTEDERDRLIDLRGTKVEYIVSSIGVFLSMLSFVLGQPPLVMFTLLILSGIVAQVIGDLSRLYLYRRGF